MPKRIIRDGILTSDAVNSLGDEAEVFYRRLMSLADDYGRYDARIPILRAALYAAKIEEKPETLVREYLDKCVAAGLVILYTVNGKPYLEICKFDQRKRSAAKWPAPDSSSPQVASNPPQTAATCQQSAADCREMPQVAALGVDEGVGVDEDECEDGGECNVATLPCSSPPTAEEVRRVMDALMLAPLVGKVMDECVARYMDDMESNGWVNRNGVPLRDWRGTARNWARRYAEREVKSLSSASSSTRRDCNDPARYRKNRRGC